MTDYEQAYRDLRAGVEALTPDLLSIGARLIRASYDDDAERLAAALGNGSIAVKGKYDRLRALLASSAPATASEDATASCFPSLGEPCGNCHRCATGVTSSDGDRGLSEEEREALDAILVALWQCETEGGYEHTRRKVEAAVERIVAARVDEAIGAALIVGATRAQPVGTERVQWEYGIRGDQDSPCRSREAAEQQLERFRRGPYRVSGRTLIRRLVGPWETVEEGD